MKGLEESANKMLQCSHCPKEFRYNSEKLRHELSHFAHFECETCSKTFSFVSALRRHQKQHERTGSVQCKKCKRKFKDEVLLNRHIKYAHKGTFICEKCKSKFNSELALRTHMKTHQPEAERRFKCSYKGCTKTFNFSHHLKHHELTHTNAKQHYCSVCGKGFIQSHHLKSHLKSHDPAGRLLCEFPGCSKKFSTDYARKRHMASHEIKLESRDTSCDGTALEASSDCCINSGQIVPHEENLVHVQKCNQLKTDSLDFNLQENTETINNVNSVDNNASESNGKEQNGEQPRNNMKPHNYEMKDTVESIYVNVATQNTKSIFVSKEKSDNNRSSIVKISNEDDVSNLYVEEWPSDPFEPINYKTNIVAADLIKGNINIKGKDNDIKLGKRLYSDQKPINTPTAKRLDRGLIVKVESVPFNDQLEQRDMCEGCDCANICDAKISMYDIPDTNLPIKEDFSSNIEYRNGVIKIRDTFDDDIVRLEGLTDNKLRDTNFVPFQTCKDVIGNCLVNGGSCLCVRMMAVEDQSVMAQEIDDITPHPKTAHS